MFFRAVYVDLDGTLLDRSHRVTGTTRAVLHHLAGRGVHLGVASGRTLRSARPHIEAAGAGAPAVLCNGARVQTPDGELHFEATLPADAAVTLIELARARGVLVNCYHGDDVTIEERGRRSEASAHKDGVRQDLVSDLVALVRARPPTKLMMIDEPAAMDNFEPRAAGRPPNEALIWSARSRSTSRRSRPASPRAAASPGPPPCSTSTSPRWSPWETPTTTSRCSGPPASGSPWPTPPPRSARPPTGSAATTTKTAWPAFSPSCSTSDRQPPG